MRNIFRSFIEFLCSSKKTVLLVLIVALVLIVISSTVSILLSKVTIKTLGVEAYWDINLENKIETIDWGKVWPISSKNATFYVQSISNVESTLYLNTTNWKPANISTYMSLSWNYNGKPIKPREIIQITLTLSVSSSRSFIIYLINNEVNEFSFDIIIGTSEYSGLHKHV